MDTPDSGGDLIDHLGIRILQRGPERSLLEVPLDRRHMNKRGIPHGGLHATLLDTAMGVAVSASDPLERPWALTLALTVNYIGAASGDILRAEGWKTGGGRTTCFAEGRVIDGTGAVVATGSGVFRYISQ